MKETQEYGCTMNLVSKGNQCLLWPRQREERPVSDGVGMGDVLGPVAEALVTARTVWSYHSLCYLVVVSLKPYL